MTNSALPNQRWDIFCAVVDNYGDIGVTWRLAKQLTTEYSIHLTLWVDDLKSFSHILPELNPKLDSQVQHGVTINHWTEPLPTPFIPADVLIEAFACNLPAEVQHSMLECHKKHKSSLGAPAAPLWLNLEYLSAEDWVEGCHGLPSLQNSGLKKYFYFPGFGAKTGGLICEKDTLPNRMQWQADPSNRLKLFTQLGLSGINLTDTVISVFSYESAALLSLCQLWAQSSTPVHALVPKGRSLNSLTSLIASPISELQAGQQIGFGNLTIHILPMTDQQGYDRLLWSCDINIVRGEDSFLRAQWAARPFVWHIYPQEDDYHLVKLDAFMDCYGAEMSPELNQLWRGLNVAFNQEQIAATQNEWQKLLLNRQALLDHAQQWPINALIDEDLASRLVQFVKNS
ncbi:elongation factor P maturation arginine rhamnosyltransferase EarP [Shewanella youngdeokensis]|uniref:Protein-arginine rhamnosyltransferase n=1 Tax=Shewanella youngdeokensis TaxID=2999068 RepID=A0ABZ0K4P9_9GAMM|nr:elongation factor P maturation arginine rhamnosyltransferase EarP [Shewanella sp. DAU334]